MKRLAVQLLPRFRAHLRIGTKSASETESETVTAIAIVTVETIVMTGEILIVLVIVIAIVIETETEIGTEIVDDATIAIVTVIIAVTRERTTMANASDATKEIVKRKRPVPLLIFSSR